MGRLVIQQVGLDLVKKEAEGLINHHFAIGLSPLLLEHEAKRMVAVQVKAGEPIPPEFAEAAQIEGLQPVELADLILAKPNSALERGNDRRKMVLQIRKASSIAEVDGVLKGIGLDTSKKEPWQANG